MPGVKPAPPRRASLYHPHPLGGRRYGQSADAMARGGGREWGIRAKKPGGRWAAGPPGRRGFSISLLFYHEMETGA
jgi:hypothetical protein